MKDTLPSQLQPSLGSALYRPQDENREQWMGTRAVLSRSLLLYSTNTWLAWAIAERYYRGIHWVWCSPFFRPERGLSPVAMPPTAIPGEIYDTLAKHVRAGDRHSPFINGNRVGILNGAKCKAEAGVITEKEHAEIVGAVDHAQIADFRPVLYVMPFRAVSRRVIAVPEAERAHSLSIEYRVEDLPRYLFDVIELGGSGV